MNHKPSAGRWRKSGGRVAAPVSPIVTPPFTGGGTATGAISIVDSFPSSSRNVNGARSTDEARLDLDRRAVPVELEIDAECPAFEAGTFPPFSDEDALSALFRHSISIH